MLSVCLSVCINASVPAQAEAFSNSLLSTFSFLTSVFLS